MTIQDGVRDRSLMRITAVIERAHSGNLSPHAFRHDEHSERSERISSTRTNMQAARMKCFAGNTSSFAIDVELTQFGRMPMGKILVWLDGRPVGTHEDDAPVSTFLHGFRRILTLKLKDHTVLDRASDDIARLIRAEALEDGDRYRLGLGESFDDFSVFGFRTGDDLTILWALNETTYFSYPDHPAGFLRAMIAADEFTRVMREFEECFSKCVGAGPRTRV